MKPADAPDFKRTLAGVFALYAKDLSDIVLSIWWEAMRPFDFAAVKDALNRHAVNPDTGQFLPKPADIVRLIGGGTQDAALIAWAALERAVRQVGVYQSVAFDDPLIHRVAEDMGGWVQFGAQTDAEWPFVRNQFVTLYRGYRGRALPVEAPPYLAGLTEFHNAAGGFHVDPPVRIGSRSQPALPRTAPQIEERVT